MPRPLDGVGHVDRLAGPEDLKQRLKVVLETVVGSKSVAQACEELQISESRLHELRHEALEGALQALMPKPAGRPATPPTTTSREEELLARIDELEVDLQAALVRTELALAMPQLFRGKKNPPHPVSKAKTDREPSGAGGGT